MQKTCMLIAALAGLSVSFGWMPDTASPAPTNAPAEEVLPEDRDWHAYAREKISTQEQVERYEEGITAMRNRMEDLLHELYAMDDDQSDALLRQNQNEWLKYADSLSEWDRDTYRGGSLSRILALESLLDEHCRRVRTLRERIEWRKPN